MYNLIIRNGTVIDGSGGAPYVADLAIKDGKIAKIAPHIEGGETVIDATGLTVTPGFIDSHSHADNALLTYPDMKEKIEQGITTAIAGQCGGSIAPLSRDYDQSQNKQIAGHGSEYEILKTMGSLIAYASNVPHGCHIATFVGHGTIRKAVMGMENRAPTAEELEKMKAMLRDALRAGAYGMSTGLYYTPGSFAKEDEVVALAKVVAEEGGVISSHIRSEGINLLEASDEFLRIIKASGARGVHSHIKSSSKDGSTNDSNGKLLQVFEKIEAANAEGADVYCDVYPYTASSTSLSASFVPKALHADGRVVENLKDPVTRAKALANHYELRKDDDLSWVLVVRADNRPDAIGKRVSQIAKERGCEPIEAVFDIIVDSNNHASACYFSMQESDVEMAICHPRAMICTDSSVAKSSTYHPRLRAAFPRAIGRYARDKQLVPLPEIIRRVTSLPAHVYSLEGKGRLQEGYDADICIFSAETFIDRATYTDCTAGCEGLSYVLVSGEVVVKDAVHNGKRCGKVLQKHRS